MNGLRICKKCKKKKSLKEFDKDKFTDRIRWRCKECRRKDGRKYYKRKTQENPDIYKRHNLKYHKYITIEDFDKLFDTQQGVCAICGKKETTKGRWGTLVRLSVDHDHKTNKVRGLLCYKCNTLLGNANDNIDILFKAIQYLRKF